MAPLFPAVVLAPRNVLVTQQVSCLRLPNEWTRCMQKCLTAYKTPTNREVGAALNEIHRAPDLTLELSASDPSTRTEDGGSRL